MRQVVFVPGLLGSRLRMFGEAESPLIWPMTELPPQTAAEWLALDGERAASALEDGLIEAQYDPLLDQLRKHADLLTLFPYDWRKRLEHSADALFTKLREDAVEIVILSHSMGGNVVQSMLERHREAPVLRRIVRVISLGAPWWGAAVSFHAMTFGRAHFFQMPETLSEERIRKTASTFESLRQLAPSDEYWRRFATFKKNSATDGDRGAHDDFPWVERMDIIGCGVPTVSDLEEDPFETDGDGIVPCFAAGYDGRSYKLKVQASHHELPAHPAALDAVERFVKRRSRSTRIEPVAAMGRSDQGQAPPHAREPIAIVGMGCRFPGGVRDPEGYWRLIAEGTDAIADIPEDRWDVRRFYDEDQEKPGKMYVKQAGFLQEDVRAFDPLCFGISPREAETLDPQQMLLLETALEAMEDAGIPAESLRGSRTGAFIGGFCLDNKLDNLSVLNRDLLGPHSGTGATMAVLSNRLSYTFDLKGPSLSVDTACSSSLVAIHYACESIWRGESDAAFAGGVNVMLRPEYFLAMSKGRFLSPHARCKAFDADAAGYVRGEGAGVLFLKPLRQAQADGDPIHAVIRATGVNQDGQTVGLTVPNADAQEELIRDVYAQAGIVPADVSYVEAHGTGTQAGDPKEAKALHAALSEGRAPDSTCWVGSVKTNIGHLEAAAGAAGLMKAVLVLKHRTVPPNLHFRRANPAIPFDTYCIRIPTEPVPISGGEKPLFAGVNSFGYGGTNAHVLIEEAPARAAAPAGTNEAFSDSIEETAKEPHRWSRGKPFLFPLSARSEESLRRRAEAYAAWIERNRPSDEDRQGEWIRDLLYSAVHRRDHLPVRAAVVAADGEELVGRLRAFAADGVAQGVVSGTRPDSRPKPAFIFTGMGPQWFAMGRELLREYPEFRTILSRYDATFEQTAGWSILAEMTKDETDSRMSDTRVAQPANFVLQAALTDLLRGWGMRPEAVAGHSVGDVSAAYVSGALPIQDAMKVSHSRSRLQHTLEGRGAMLAVGWSPEEASAKLQGRGDVSVAAANSRSNVTLAGERGALEEIAKELEETGVFARFLRVNIPYHSPLMEAIRAPLLAALDDIRPTATTLSLYSTVTGERSAGERYGARYWYRNVREPVRFERTLQSMLRDGFDVFVEIGPHPVLATAMTETFRSQGRQARHISTLRRQEPEVARLLSALAEWYVLGLPVHWERLYPVGEWLGLPLYPYQKIRFDVQTVANQQDLRGFRNADLHPWLQSKSSDPVPTWEVEISPNYLPYVSDHQIEGAVVLPAAAYVEAALALATAEAGFDACRLEGIDLQQALIVEPKRVQDLHMRYTPDSQRFHISSRLHRGQEPEQWSTHATGLIRPPHADADAPAVAFDAWEKECTEALEPDALYAMLDEAGLTYGPAFRTIRSLRLGGRRNLVTLEVNRNGVDDAERARVHPTLLDGAFQSLLSIVMADQIDGARTLEGSLRPFIPAFIERFDFYAPVGTRCWASAVIHTRNEREIVGDLVLFDDDGRVLAEARGLVCRALDSGEDEAGDLKRLQYVDVWKEWERKEGESASGLEPNGAGSMSSAYTWIWYSPDQGDDLSAEVMCAAEGCEVRVYRSLEDMLEGVRTARESGTGEVRVVWMAAPERDEARTMDWSRRAASHSDELAQFFRHLRPEGQEEAEHDASPRIRLDVVTCGTQPVLSSADVVSPADSSLWGVAAVGANEVSGLGIRKCDLPAKPEARDRQACLQWLFDVTAPDEVAIRRGVWWTRALVPFVKTRETETSTADLSLATTEPLELRMDQPGRIDDLYFGRVKRRPPGPGEIEILVHHAALNYKDLLKTLGQIADQVVQDTYFGHELGMESAGVVVAVGEGVTRFKAGDEVVASVAGFRTYATVPEIYTVRKPRNIAFSEAPVYLGYMTAYYGLMDVARLQPGESVLIHNATGGVGLAAVQIAKWVGAEVFATAGTEEKREYLRRLDVKHVYHSRSTKFVDDVWEATGGRGVDVVLNAIAGETLQKSFELLASFGRFVEIGKRDIGENSGLPMRAFNRNLTFAAVDLDRMLLERPDVSNRLIWKITEHIERSDFGPLPVREFPATQAHDAFRTMSQSQHIGKIVLRFSGERVPVRPSLPGDEPIIRSDGAYIVTGGTGGLGLEIGRWLIENGAGRVYLLSRRGMTAECKRTLQDLGEQAARVEVLAADVTRRDDVDAILGNLPVTGLTLRGIFHCAMVLDDDYLDRLTLERFTAVIAPKVAGTQVLAESLVTEPNAAKSLDFFVMFSSISSVIGNPGQGNYVAANAVLDAAAHYLSAAGVRALTVNLGVLSGVGVASRNERLETVLHAAGIRALTPMNAVRGTHALLHAGAIQAGLFDVDWAQWASVYPDMASSGRFASLVGASSSGSDGAQNRWASTLAELTDEERNGLLTEHMRTLFCNILKMPVTAVATDAPISQMGMDSLMAIELRHLLKEEFDAEFTTLELLRGPTLEELAATLPEKWGTSATAVMVPA